MAERAANSRCIEPAYSVSLATSSKFAFKVSKLSTNELMCLFAFSPNISTIICDRLTPWILVSASNTASNASFPRPLSIISVYSVIDIPSWSKASRAAPDDTGISFRRLAIILIAVPAISGDLPIDTKVPARAETSLYDKPNVLAIAPARKLTSVISGAVAAMLLDRWLMTSPTLLISEMGICNTFDNLAIDWPASSAVISNATDICAAVSAKAVSSDLATPN